jgi:peptidyl-dipeptidase Dcp
MKERKMTDSIINPLLGEWNTPYGTPPFQLFSIHDFKPAIEEAIEHASSEIEAIASDTAEPDFNNVVAALDRAGGRLGDITSILFNLNSAESSKEMQATAQEVSPLLARFSNDITLNEKLFARIKSVYDKRESSGLSREETQLLEKHYRNFILGGADLEEAKKTRFREISEELSHLQIKFEENVLDETNAYELHITDINDLAGLPEGIREMAAAEAESRKKSGWIFTLHAPSYIPFMKYADNSHLREEIFRAYGSRSFRGNEFDNQKLAVRIVNLRLELSRLLGFNNYAELALVDRMASSSEKALSFLNELHEASFSAAERDFRRVNEFASKSGKNIVLQKWDWAYYSEKLQKAEFDIDDEVLRPYFILENAERGILDLAKELYGISFRQLNSIPVYNQEVKCWEVFDENGVFLAILYIDYFPRPGKNGGAWMTAFREQKVENGVDTRPFISIVANFTRPSASRPALLTFNEVTTFLHEFGHSLHGMLSRCTYESLSGTSVARDFIELPSQFMENFAYEKKWLEKWARHYISGEVIPDELIEKIKASSTFNEGYACNRQLGFGFLDMAWHTIESEFEGDLSGFERKALSKTELFPTVEGLNTSVSFTHIFGGGYAAGYYGYKWAEVLDADAFEYFRENGIFCKECAASFRKNILEKGGSEKPSVLYKAFRGNVPSMEPFLVRSGLK